MIFIYVLKLEQEKYYVGKTEHPNFRLEEHFEFGGCAWTQLYKPIEVIELISNCSKYDEDKYTKIYMEQHGISNVRGGSFCKVELSKSDYEILLKMIAGANDKCYICGQKGHFSANCLKKIRTIPKRYSYSNKSTKCYRCGRYGHWANQCYAKTYVDYSDDDYSDDSDDYY